jgi:hypothetical protein
MAMARSLRTKSWPSKSNSKPLFSMDCLTQPAEDAFYRVNENLLRETGVSTFLASVLFKNRDSEKIKKHVKEVAKGLSEDKFKYLLKNQPNLNYKRLEDDIKPMLKILNIPQDYAKLFLIDIKKAKIDLPEEINANYLVGIHDSRKNVTRILRLYETKTVELKMLGDLKKDGIKIIE